MSKVDLGHAASIVSRKTLAEDLIEFMDEDFNGNNGSDFTSDEAIEAGCDSDYDFVLAKALEKGGTLEDIINFVLTKSHVDNHYYDDTSVIIVPIDENSVFLSLAHTS